MHGIRRLARPLFVLAQPDDAPRAATPLRRRSLPAPGSRSRSMRARSVRWARGGRGGCTCPADLKRPGRAARWVREAVAGGEGVPDRRALVCTTPTPADRILSVATCRAIRFSDVLQGTRSKISLQIAIIFADKVLFGWIRSITLRRDVQGRHEIELDVGERCKAPRSERSEADRATAGQLVRVVLRGAKPRLTDPSASRMGGDPRRW
jgi:hypothetical protein